MPRNPALDALESGSWKQLGNEEFARFVSELQRAPREVDTTAPEHAPESDAEVVPVQKSAEGLGGAIHKTTEDALVSHPASEWPFLLLGDPEKDELLADTMGFIIAELRREWRSEMRELKLGLRGPPGERGAPGHMPSIIPWNPNGISYAGMCVTHRGSSWQAARDTVTEPSLGAPDWQPVALGATDAMLSMQRSLIERQQTKVERLEARVAELERRMGAVEKCGK